jgi:hypothetical protein
MENATDEILQNTHTFGSIRLQWSAMRNTGRSRFCSKHFQDGGSALARRRIRLPVSLFDRCRDVVALEVDVVNLVREPRLKRRQPREKLGSVAGRNTAAIGFL